MHRVRPAVKTTNRTVSVLSPEPVDGEVSREFAGSVLVGESDQLITNQPKEPTESTSEHLRHTKDEDLGEK